MSMSDRSNSDSPEQFSGHSLERERVRVTTPGPLRHHSPGKQNREQEQSQSKNENKYHDGYENMYQKQKER